jgi:tyrosine-protein kinase Etk/Wzc
MFGLNDEYGLSQVISGEVKLTDCIHSEVIKNLDIVPSGQPAPNPADLLLSKNFNDILVSMSQSYDFVIIDSPPVLALADAMIIGQMSGTTLLVVRDNENTLREIVQSIKRLRQANVNLVGAVYNGIRLTQSGYGYGYTQYYGYRKRKV